MSSELAIVSRQTWALMRRYLIIQKHHYAKSTVRFLLWPLLVTLLSSEISLIENWTEDKRVFFNVLMATCFHIWSFSEYLILDRSIGMKSLMLSMGLRRKSYYLANSLSFILVTLPAVTIVAVKIINYVLIESKLTTLEISFIFMLYIFHVIAILFISASAITSSLFVLVIVITILLQFPLHKFFIYLLMKNWPAYLRPWITFLGSVSPFESIRIFIGSYVKCKNDCAKTEFDLEDHVVSEPTYLLELAMIFWILGALCFARWLEEVCPWQTDSAIKGPFFFLKMYEKCQEIGDENNARRQDDEYFEQVDEQREVGISIRNITKSFKDVIAVNEFSLNIYKGETTLLLGHNGAGKSTLINIILNKLTPDRGCVTTNQHTSVGVCPQDSIFDVDLSVRQHLQLFLDIKPNNLSKQEMREHIDKTIADVKLDGHSEKLPSELSAGMKRKLSLAMAFIGNSDVLILDEPSSNLDIESRMFIWNAIRRFRRDRTVLLSTQQMDEADYLGDRIAIMSDGRMICCGSSIFLNKAFGSSYKLRIECSFEAQSNVLDHMKSHFNQFYMSYRILANDRAENHAKIEVEIIEDDRKVTECKLIELLEQLEDDSIESIKTYRLRSSSMEDVMINSHKLLFMDNLNGRQWTAASTQKMNLQSATSSTTLNHIKTLSSKQTTCISNNSQLTFLRALLIKNIQLYKNDWKTVVLFRVLFTLIAVTITVFDMKENIITDDYSPPLAIEYMIVHFIYYPTLERATGFKAMQLNTYANPLVYWLSFLVVDFVSVLVIALYFNVFIFTVFYGSYKYHLYFVHTIITLAVLLFGISGALGSYILSNVFENPRTCMAYQLLVHFSSLAIYTMIYLINKLVDRPEITALREILDEVFQCFYPTDALEHILQSLTAECYIPLNESRCKDYRRGLEKSEINVGFKSLAFQIGLFSLILFWMHRHKDFDLNWYRHNMCYPIKTLFRDLMRLLTFMVHLMCSIVNRTDDSKEKQPASSDDCDYLEDSVQEEKLKALELVQSGNGPRATIYSLVAVNLNKSYRHHQPRAVKDLNFTLNRGECFGLLGVNGAGKTTTFSLISGELKIDYQSEEYLKGELLASELEPKNGSIWINGHFDRSQYRQTIGYDPQASLNCSMNSIDILYLMARLRQINEHCIPMLVISLLELLDMQEYAFKLVNSQLSGGSKRKLALAMSLIGNPELLLLDEPTAGIDPMSRIKIWALLKQLQAQNECSILLSSHLMEECQELCNRIGILSSGQLLCLGTHSQLISKFSHGCRLRVQFSHQTEPDTAVKDIYDSLMGQLSGCFARNFGGPELVRLVDTNINSVTFNFDRSVKKSKLLRFLREFELPDRHLTIHYKLSDSALEDIFIGLATADNSCGRR